MNDARPRAAVRLPNSRRPAQWVNTGAEVKHILRRYSLGTGKGMNVATMTKLRSGECGLPVQALGLRASHCLFVISQAKSRIPQ
jgi:hypothetical protein